MPDDEPDLSPPGEEDWQAAEERHTALPPKVESWRRRSVTGAILTGFALGLREALDTNQEEPSIIMETSGQPPKELPVEADLEQRPARRSVVKIRPWLLAEDAGAAADRSDKGEVATPQDRDG